MKGRSLTSEIWVMGAAQHIKWCGDKVYWLVCKRGDPTIKQTKISQSGGTRGRTHCKTGEPGKKAFGLLRATRSTVHTADRSLQMPWK